LGTFIWLHALLETWELKSCSRSLCDAPKCPNETAAGLLRYEQKWGPKTMNRHDQELLDKQMRRLSPPRNEGVVVVMLATMFLFGMALGSVMSPHKSEPVQIASME